MAEALLHVGGEGDPRDERTFQDGDVIEIFTDTQIRYVNANTICHPRFAPFTREGLRSDGLARGFFEATKQYRIERIGSERFRTTNLFDGRSAEADNLAHLRFIQRAVMHPLHAIFGTPGRQVFYAGLTKIDAASVSAVWNHIETNSEHRLRNYLNYPRRPRERRHMLMVTIDDLSDARASALGEAEHEVVEEMIGGAPDTTERTLRKRIHNIPWQDALDGMSDGSRNDTPDRSKEVDIRGEEKSYDVETVVVDKRDPSIRSGNGRT